MLHPLDATAGPAKGNIIMEESSGLSVTPNGEVYQIAYPCLIVAAVNSDRRYATGEEWVFFRWESTDPDFKIDIDFE